MPFMARTASRRPPKALVPRIKVWLEIDGRYAFGFGLARMLQAVEQTGSIKQAAADLGLSYRYVWGRIKDAEAALGQALVRTQVGGQGSRRSSLTPLAQQFLASFLRLRTDLVAEAARQFDRHADWPQIPGP
jgi:molybdate transport system regulatory protein